MRNSRQAHGAGNHFFSAKALASDRAIPKAQRLFWQTIATLFVGLVLTVLSMTSAFAAGDPAAGPAASG